MGSANFALPFSKNVLVVCQQIGMTKGVLLMQGYFAIATVVCLVIMVLLRVLLLRKMGIKAMKYCTLEWLFGVH